MTGPNKEISNFVIVYITHEKETMTKSVIGCGWRLLRFGNVKGHLALDPETSGDNKNQQASKDVHAHMLLSIPHPN